MVEVEQPGAATPDEFPQSSLALQERQASQVLSVQEEQVEGIVVGLAAPEHQLIKL